MPKAKKNKTKGELPDPLSCIEKAGELTLEWTTANGFDLLRIEPVTPSVTIHKRFSVWLFFATDSVLNEYEANGTNGKIKDKYVSCLQKLKCPDEYLQGVIFFTDSDENAERYSNLTPVEIG